MSIEELEKEMWEAAKARDPERFSTLIDNEAVMVCGGYKCSGAEYCEIIKDFDIKDYRIWDFEVIAESDNLCQVHYMIETKVNNEENRDLEGIFHITTTRKRIGDIWKVVFNMDSRVADF